MNGDRVAKLGEFLLSDDAIGRKQGKLNKRFTGLIAPDGKTCGAVRIADDRLESWK